MTGLAVSSETLISPACAAHWRHLPSTIWLSWPGIGERTVP